MPSEIIIVLASFTSPENIGTNPMSMLWLLPLATAIESIYKATKLPKITVGNFIKEVAALSGSIVVFLVIAAIALCTLASFFT